MTDLLAVWHNEHRNFARLLEVLETELRRFRTGEQPNYSLMQDVMFYMIHFSDAMHHTREDLAFERIREREPGVALLIDTLSLQHSQMKAAGEKLVADLAHIVDGSVMSREEVESEGWTYITTFRNHMQAEESQILPLARRILRDSDWVAIEAAIERREDPVFGRGADRRYAALRSEIERETGRVFAGVGRR